MKRILVSILTLTFVLGASAHEKHKTHKKADANQTHFGAKLTETKFRSLNEVVSNFDKYKDKTVAIEATPEKVCEKSGCWMVLKDGKHQVRTLFKDYGFFVPASIVGKKVRVQGVMEQKKISAATRRHFLKDAGAKLEEIKKIKTSEVQYQFTADAVEVI